MIIEMTQDATEEQVRDVCLLVREKGFETQLNSGQERTVIAVLGSRTGQTDTQNFERLSGVEKVFRIEKPFKLASRNFHGENTVVRVRNAIIGGKKPVIMAGPCAVESEEQILSCAEIVRKIGGKVLRGGAFKPRSSPFSFQGLGEEGLKLLARARDKTGLAVLTEVVSSEDVALVSDYADILQIGSRNMQNFKLLEKAGNSGLPVLLKRGLASTIEEWLTAADYLLRSGKSEVILCERGIRTFGNYTRFTLDIGAVPVVKRFSHLPVVVDPSHAAGYFEYVPSLAKAAIAAGADGILVEIHPDPAKALSDGAQSLTFSDFSRLVEDINRSL
jgi:3-deoxy-7-phosphoheptulonate synthase